MIEKLSADVLQQIQAAQPKQDSGPSRKSAAAESALKSAAPAADAPSYGFGLRVDEGTHEVIAVIVDRDTGKVVREIPSEDMRTASKVIRNLIGPLVDKVA
jgi:uncharacterized FlaG/YvyC family protein